MVNPEPPILDFVDDELDARRMAEAMADIAAGRLIPNEEVSQWLMTWGTPDEAPAPAHWFKR